MARHANHKDDMTRTKLSINRETLRDLTLDQQAAPKQPKSGGYSCGMCGLPTRKCSR